MADTYGLSFSPTASLDKSNKPTDPNANVQEAIRTLALRIPKVTGAKGFAPDALMGAAGASAAPQGGLGLDRLLAMLFGNQTSQGGPQAAPMGGLGGTSAPAPRVGGLGGTSAPAPRVGGLGNEMPSGQELTTEPPSMPSPPSMPDPVLPRTYGKPIDPGSY